MNIADHWRFSVPVFSRHRARTLLLVFAVAIGVAAVILLTSLGEGARRFIDREFASLGSQMLVILPGKKETSGGAPPMYGTTPRDLTIEDAQALAHINSIDKIAPIIAGTALVSFDSVSREVITIGSNQHLFDVRKLTLSRGQLLPNDSAEHAAPVAVLGAKLVKELFGNKDPLGQWVAIGDYKFRVIGTLSERGESMGLDLRDMAIIGVRSAEMLFDSPALFRILLQLKHPNSEAYTEQRVRKIIAARHEGEDDISFVSQDSVLQSFNSIITIVTAAVGAIAGISLIVAGVLIMNVTFISVAQRRSEIGLLKAVGASSAQVKSIFIWEAALLVSGGAILGLVLSGLGVYIAQLLFPQFPLAPPWWAVLAAVATAFVVGLLFSWLPAKRAAALDPILALQGRH